MENKTQFAKVADFETPRHCKVLDFKKVVASKFGDKNGQTNQLTLIDLREERQMVLESSSYGFYLDFKNAKLTSGDECVIFSVKFQNPKDPEKSYRRWIFQKIYEGNKTDDQRD